MMKWMHQCRGVSSNWHHLSDVCYGGGVVVSVAVATHTPESSSWRTEEAECHEEAEPPHATLLTETLVGVAMCSFG